MRERLRLSVMALGMLLCSVIPAAIYAQEKLEIKEQPQVVSDHSPEAVTAALQTGATSVADSEVARAGFGMGSTSTIVAISAMAISAATP